MGMRLILRADHNFHHLFIFFCSDSPGTTRLLFFSPCCLFPLLVVVCQAANTPVRPLLLPVSFPYLIHIQLKFVYIILNNKSILHWKSHVDRHELPGQQVLKMLKMTTGDCNHVTCFCFQSRCNVFICDYDVKYKAIRWTSSKISRKKHRKTKLQGVWIRNDCIPKI